MYTLEKIMDMWHAAEEGLANSKERAASVLPKVHHVLNKLPHDMFKDAVGSLHISIFWQHSIALYLAKHAGFDCLESFIEELEAEGYIINVTEQANYGAKKLDVYEGDNHVIEITVYSMFSDVCHVKTTAVMREVEQYELICNGTNYGAMSHD